MDSRNATNNVCDTPTSSWMRLWGWFLPHLRLRTSRDTRCLVGYSHATTPLNVLDIPMVTLHTSAPFDFRNKSCIWVANDTHPIRHSGKRPNSPTDENGLVCAQTLFRPEATTRTHLGPWVLIPPSLRRHTMPMGSQRLLGTVRVNTPWISYKRAPIVARTGSRLHERRLWRTVASFCPVADGPSAHGSHAA